jgi:hypothetical protein
VDDRKPYCFFLQIEVGAVAKRKFIASKWDQKWRPKLCEIQFTFTTVQTFISSSWVARQ